MERMDQGASALKPAAHAAYCEIGVPDEKRKPTFVSPSNSGGAVARAVASSILPHLQECAQQRVRLHRRLSSSSGDFRWRTAAVQVAATTSSRRRSLSIVGEPCVEAGGRSPIVTKLEKIVAEY